MELMNPYRAGRSIVNSKILEETSRSWPTTKWLVLKMEFRGGASVEKIKPLIHLLYYKLRAL